MTTPEPTGAADEQPQFTPYGQPLNQAARDLVDRQYAERQASMPPPGEAQAGAPGQPVPVAGEGYQQPYGQQGAPGYGPPPGYAPGQPPAPGYGAPGYPPAPGYGAAPGYPPPPGYPPYPGSYPVSAGTVTKTPLIVAAAVAINIALGALAVIYGFILMASPAWPTIATTLTDSSSGSQDALGAARGAIIFMVGAFLGLYLLFSLKMKAGRNWARVVLTVFAGLGVLMGISAEDRMFIEGRWLDFENFSTFGYLSAALCAVVLVIMWLPDANEFFAKRKQEILRSRLH